MTYFEKIVDLSDDTVTQRPYTEAEIAEVENAKMAAEAELAKQAEAAAAKVAAQAKLAALGLTKDDLKALGLQVEHLTEIPTV